MATPFKMKGSPMQRNFNFTGDSASTTPKYNIKSKGNFNFTGSKASTTPKYNPKSGNFNWKGSSKAGKFAKWVGKGSKFLGGKALGVAGMMMATSSKADQPKGKAKKKGSYTGDFTKLK